MKPRAAARVMYVTSALVTAAGAFLVLECGLPLPGIVVTVIGALGAGVLLAWEARP